MSLLFVRGEEEGEREGWWWACKGFVEGWKDDRRKGKDRLQTNDNPMLMSNNSIETWALEEAKRRLQAEGILPEEEDEQQ